MDSKRLKIQLWGKIVLIIGGCSLAGAWVLHLKSSEIMNHKWVPLSVPIVLAKDKLVQAQFSSDLGGTYDLVLSVDRSIPVTRASCLLGESPKHSRCNPEDASVHLIWTIVAGGDHVAAGDSDQFHFYGGIHRTIGHFVAKPKTDYSLRVDIQKDGGELNRASPSIKMEFDKARFKDAVVSAYILHLASLVFAAVGTVAVLVVGLVQLYRYIRTTSNPTPAG